MATSYSNITGIVLAGGESSRMGSAKSLLKFKGKPLLKYAIKAIIIALI
jgi:molybdopterin-guanine dinucleotide biosynthesis protein A